ncbi:MAG: ATP-binding protein [Caldisericaceae bacterium]|nr:ATP-binding protein [Caldisericaceae bacterium]
MELAHLNELHLLALEEAQKYPRRRFIFDKIVNDKGKHFIGIVGPRGSGKTILLKQMAANHPDSFYLSIDVLPDIDLFQVAKQLIETQRIKYLLFDEIHFNANFAREIKKIYDFLDVKVIFTSSASLVIHQSELDLSRRVKFFTMFPFSFREFIYFKSETLIPRLELKDIWQRGWERTHLLYDYLFESFLKGGIMPFSLEEENILPLLKNVLKKILYGDLPAIQDLRTSELLTIEKLVQFIGKAEIDGINYTSLSRNVGITKYKAERYVQLLERAFILNVVYPTGTNVLREPKITMNLPYRLLFRSFDEAIGAIREDFAVEMLKAAGYDFFYLKSTRGEKTPDYLVKTGEANFIIEIGGKGKGRQQFKGVKENRKMIFVHDDRVNDVKRPLFLLGFLI